MTYRIGFLGCGGRGRTHATAYRNIDNVEFAAASDVDSGRLESFREQFGVKRGYGPFQDMLANEELDILHIATQPTLRREPTIMAAERGVKVILSEKPIALSLPELDEMLEACKKSETTLVINHQLRYQTNWIKLREAVESGVIGDISIIRVSCWHNLMGQGTHILDLVISMLNDTSPTRVAGLVYGDGDFATTHASPNNAIGVLQFGKECRCYFEIGPDAPAVPNETNFSLNFQMQICGNLGRAETSLDKGYRIWGKGDSDWVGEYIPYGTQDAASQVAMTADLLRCIEDKDFIHPCDARTGRISFEIIEAICHSSLRRTPVDVPLDTSESALLILKQKAN